MNFSREQIEAAQTPAELTALLSARGSSPRWAVSTLTDVAEFFGLAVSTVKGWSQEGMPNAIDGWSLPEIVRWRFARLSNSDLATAKKQQDLALGQVQLERKRIELSKERSELVDRADVERWAATALVETREIVMSLPERLATSCPTEIRNFVREEADRTVRAALTTLRRRLARTELDKELTSGNVADDDEPQAKKPDQ